MSRRFSPWLLLIVLLAVCAAVIMLLSYRRSRTAASVADLVNRLPSADSMVLAIDVSALRRSGILDLVAGNKVVEEPEYRLFVEQTGFDYRENLDFVLAAFDRGETQMFLRGDFDWTKLRQYVITQRGACLNAFCRMEGSQPERRVSFFPLRRDTMALVVSKDEWAAIKLQRGPKPRPPFQAPARPVWLLVPAGALKDREDLPAGTRLFVKAMQDAERIVISLGGQPGRFEAYLDVTCKTPADASVLATQLEGVTALLRGLLAKEKKTPNPRDLSGVLVMGTFSREDRLVHGRWPVEQVFLEALAGGAL